MQRSAGCQDHSGPLSLTAPPLRHILPALIESGDPGTSFCRGASAPFPIPLFGILWAVLFLHEPVTLGLFAGLGVILLSVWLVLGEKRGEAAGGGRE